MIENSELLAGWQRAALPGSHSWVVRAEVSWEEPGKGGCAQGAPGSSRRSHMYRPPSRGLEETERHIWCSEAACDSVVSFRLANACLSEQICQAFLFSTAPESSKGMKGHRALKLLFKEKEVEPVNEFSRSLYYTPAHPHTHTNKC